MKEKFLAVLKTEWSKLGLRKEALDRVASQRVKTIEKEEDIVSAAKDTETMNLLMAELQGSADAERQQRSQIQKDFEDYKSKHPEASEGGEGEEDPKSGFNAEEVAKMISDAVSAAVTPIKESFDTFKSQSLAKESLTTAKSKFFSNKWTDRYKEEAEEAWDRASELNEAQGSKMTADELSEKATAYFNKSVQRKGVDATQPFPSEGGEGGSFDFSDQVKMLENQNLIPKEEK